MIKGNLHGFIWLNIISNCHIMLTSEKLHSQYLGESFTKFTFHFCVDNVINKDFPDIVFGSQTSQNIVKITKQASTYNFYTCLASQNANIWKKKR